MILLCELLFFTNNQTLYYRRLRSPNSKVLEETARFVKTLENLNKFSQMIHPFTRPSPSPIEVPMVTCDFLTTASDSQHDTFSLLQPPPSASLQTLLPVPVELGNDCPQPLQVPCVQSPLRLLAPDEQRPEVTLENQNHELLALDLGECLDQYFNEFLPSLASH